nr:hypothetical protein [Dysgonomonas sp. Marseille-P4677]
MKKPINMPSHNKYISKITDAIVIMLNNMNSSATATVKAGVDKFSKWDKNRFDILGYLLKRKFLFLFIQYLKNMISSNSWSIKMIGNNQTMIEKLNII